MFFVAITAPFAVGGGGVVVTNVVVFVAVAVVVGVGGVVFLICFCNFAVFFIIKEILFRRLFLIG